MTSNKLGVALIVWLIGVAVVGGYYNSQLVEPSNANITAPLDALQPFSTRVVVERPVIVPLEELGPPSTGTTHIYQTIIPEADNPYSMTDAESVSNFNASAEGQFIQTLFTKINSPSDVTFSKQLTHLKESDLSPSIQISPTLQRMFYGYRPSDDPKYFLYDNNLMHQFMPHAPLLRYIQSVRPDSSYSARIRGSVLPKVTNDIPARVKVYFQNREVVYLVRQSAGTFLVESIGSDTKHFMISYQLNVGIPYDLQTEGFPFLLWPGGIHLTINPVDLVTWETNQEAYFVGE